MGRQTLVGAFVNGEKKLKTFITEPARKTPVVAEVDVVVAGGGVAGTLAAISAARNGARTLVIESGGNFGGYFDRGPGGLVAGVSFQDMNGKQVIKGISWEFMERIFKMGGGIPINDIEIPKSKLTDKLVDIPRGSFSSRHTGKSKPSVDYEAVRTLSIEMLEEANAEMLLFTKVVGVLPAEGMRNGISGLIVENKSGRQAVIAKVVVDCTGDADVAAYAGAPFDKSPREELYEVSHDYKISYNNSSDGKLHISSLGADTSGFDGSDGKDLSDAEIALWKLFWRKFQEYRAHPENSNVRVIGWNHVPTIGVRETRRIVGEYIFTEQDLVEGRKFADGVVRAACPIDMHMKGHNIRFWIVKTDAYDVPYRCLLPLQVENLLVAGRCISCTHIAQAGLRKVPVCMALGEAAGTAAALSIKLNVTPRRLDVELLRNTIAAQGASIWPT